MTRFEAETKICELIKEAVKVLKDFEPNSNYLAMSYHNGNIIAYNDAFMKDEIQPIDVNVEGAKV